MAKPPTKSLLKPPKKILSAWQIFYSEFLEQCKQQNPKLNIPEVAKEAGLRWANMKPDEREAYNTKASDKKAEYGKLFDDWLATLSREDYERENAFRKAQRTAGKSRKADLKDPNKPKRPMSAYFFYQQHLKQLPNSTDVVFGGETNATKQASIAGSRWRNLREDEKKEFHELATQDRVSPSSSNNSKLCADINRNVMRRKTRDTNQMVVSLSRDHPELAISKCPFSLSSTIS